MVNEFLWLKKIFKFTYCLLFIKFVVNRLDMVVSEIKLFQIAREKFGEKTAEEFVSAIKQTVDEKFDEQKGIFLTKDDKVDIMRSIYLVGVIQFLAIVGSVIAIISFMFK
jgi:hypothetical protein